LGFISLRIRDLFDRKIVHRIKKAGSGKEYEYIVFIAGEGMKFKFIKTHQPEYLKELMLMLESALIN